MSHATVIDFTTAQNLAGWRYVNIGNGNNTITQDNENGVLEINASSTCYFLFTDFVRFWSNNQFSLEIDVEWVTDPNNYKFFMLAVFNELEIETSSYAVYRAGHYAGANAATVWPFYYITGLPLSGVFNTYAPALSNSPPELTLGQIYRFMLERTAAGQFALYVDGVEIYRITDSAMPGPYVPGIYLTTGITNIHRIAWKSNDYEPDIISKALSVAELSWGNTEIPSQAFPGQNHWEAQTAPTPELAAPISQLPHLTTPPIRDELGYIAGVVTVKQVPAPGRTVRCFDPTMTLVAETVSDAGGHYRFDNLLRNRRYLILAQDTWEFNYAPVGADRRTPEAYP